MYAIVMLMYVRIYSALSCCSVVNSKNAWSLAAADD